MELSRASDHRLVRWAMTLSRICLVFYALNVLLGKGAITFKWTVPRLGDVAEFLLVLASVTFFVVGLIAGEAASDKPTEKP